MHTTKIGTDGLFREVWLRPEDDELRRVLADALVEEGDPRGELIHWQLSPRRGFEHVPMRLLQQYGLTWLGALRGAVTPVAYERGFLASCVLHRPALARDADEWATVHTIELADDLPFELGYFTAPVMRSLRMVIVEHEHDRLQLAFSRGTVTTISASYTPTVVQAIAALHCAPAAIEIEDVPDERATFLEATLRTEHPQLASVVLHPRVYRY